MGCEGALLCEPLSTRQTDKWSDSLVALFVLLQRALLAEALIAEGAEETHRTRLMHASLVLVDGFPDAEAAAANFTLERLQSRVFPLVVIEGALRGKGSWTEGAAVEAVLLMAFHVIKEAIFVHEHLGAVAALIDALPLVGLFLVFVCNLPVAVPLGTVAALVRARLGVIINSFA